jgi:hypothetical protein
LQRKPPQTVGVNMQPKLGFSETRVAT